MTTSTFSTYPASQPTGNYAGNLSCAFAQLISALFAARPQAAVLPQPAAVVSEARKTINLAKLYRLSSGRDTVSPALLAELKAVSERGSDA